ncbi:MAG: amidohydrolase family protein [Planctomycetota bacterium]
MNGLGVVTSLGAVAVFASSSLGQLRVIQADAVHVGNGTVHAPGWIAIEGDEIVAVGGDMGAMPSDDPEVHWGAITPGLIDANARVERLDAFAEYRVRGGTVLERVMRGVHSPDQVISCSCSGHALCPVIGTHEPLASEGLTCPVCSYPSHVAADAMAPGLISVDTYTEAASEVVPHTRVIDSVNIRGADLDRLVEGGVTTAYLSPDSTAVIGPRGAVLRTAGRTSRRVIERESDVHAAINSAPYFSGPSNNQPNEGSVTNRSRRPTTRMGVAWVFRKAFHDAAEFARGLTPDGADTAPTEAFPVLNEVRDGDVGLRIHSRALNDIESALRLSAEFGMGFTLLEGTEAYGLIPELREAGVPVVFGPIYMRPSGERTAFDLDFFLFTNEVGANKLDTLKTLIDAGIPTALSAQDLRDEDGLARQAMYAIRYGLAPEDALRAVTLTPAEILGLDNEIGSLEAGKRADLVLWNGEPFAATAKPVEVVVGGKTVVDRR